MTPRRLAIWSIASIAVSTVVGCAAGVTIPSAELTSMLSEVQVEAPTVAEVVAAQPTRDALSPFTVSENAMSNWSAPEPWEMTIDQVIQLALANSTVLRDLGARVIQTPELTPTIYGPAITASDATNGVEAALSEFDAQFNSDIFFEDNDRILNNEFLGGGVNDFKQTLTRMETSLSKRTVSGTQFILRHNFDGDQNNSSQNLLEDRAWAWNLEGEVRHPLLQGRGVDFNRVAGPNATPGVYNGVVIARLNADISVAQLEIALRDYLSEVENAYWDLYFAYADLEVKKKARDRSLNTYQLLKARQGLPGAENDKLAQAKEQYFRFEQDVQNSLAGRLFVGTRNFNGSGAGTFQGTGGVYVSERRLRMIMGLPINDGRLIRTTTQPIDAPVTYQWNDVVSTALTRRTELRKQRLQVDRRRHELTASRNFLLPRVDAVGRYRYRALGDSLYDTNVQTIGTTGTHEWLMGFSVAYPVGLRQAYSGVRNAQLNLARERALMNELERQVVYGLSNAIAECDRAFNVLRMAINREHAAKEQYDILAGEAQAKIRQFDFNSLLDSEQRFAEASTAANRARVQYALATKNLNFEMGALLEYFNIQMADEYHAAPTVVSADHSVVDSAGVESSLGSGAIHSEPADEASQGVAGFEDRSDDILIGQDAIDEIIERELGMGESVVDGTVVEDRTASPSDRESRSGVRTR